ncbi:MAG TPA: hypothetical protein VN931_08710, partial [Fibrobacteria bacterium]|nr:hypothetical protein [Fibrobacteria bacterium]
LNRWPGLILRVDRDQGLARIVCEHGTDILHALVVDDGAPWIRSGQAVHLLFKETEVVVSPAGMAPWPGAFRAAVVEVRFGQVLTAISMDRTGEPLGVLLDSAVARALELRPGIEVDLWIPPAALALEDGGA